MNNNQLKSQIKTSKQAVLTKVIVPSCIAICLATNSVAGWQDLLTQQADSFLKSSEPKAEPSVPNNSSATASNNSSANKGYDIANLSNGDITGGLKEALNLGVKKAVDLLGKEGGFNKDELVKIAMPEKMKKMDELLRKAGQGKIADDFIASMNTAAEKAVPKVSNIFVNSLKGMSIKDAQNILTGNDDSATQYFKTNTSGKIQQLIKPYIKEAMDSQNVSSYYKTVMDYAKQYDTYGLMNMYFGDQSLNVEDYVTDKTMEGLFSKIALNEKEIRDNPAFRSTDLMKKVFSQFGF